MIVISSSISKKDLIKADKRVMKEGGIRPQWVELPENEDLVEKTNKKSKEVIGVIKTNNL